ncbi:putative kinase [Wickerhamomyces ciferrii]|uniref:Kinase n=1 Tax=Wickerhamomyces ciferrii (strain ATCC 14091 / BCRC 22168 / CBS 111 / JCM 3599 / NBRC 0793 / NRRL Y-1031 F-60-10) TaxID=1206466 RepID=K0KIX9_WICCF|nr:putative kinase [Wickerhamomyces ciferrii]CCH41088.1 putative kinase [Wickerhamomyces ciferrii]
MNFLSKTFTSLTGGSIPYNFGEEQVPNPSYIAPIWKIYDGTKKDDGTPCTIFEFDIKARPDLLPLASNSLRKIRGIRLPGILKILDTFENDSNLYIVSERVQSLANYLKNNEDLTEQIKLLVIHSVAKAIKYINVEGSSVLGYLDFTTVFINERGEFKLGGFEVVTNLKSDPDQALYRLSGKLSGFNELLSPEVASNGIDVLRGSQAIKFDTWRLAVFIYKLFNIGKYSITNDDITKGSKVPRSLLAAYKKLIASSVTVRPTVDQLLKNGTNSYFNTDLITAYKELDEFQLRDDQEKLQFFQNIENVKNDAPPGFLENRIIPELITFFTQSPENAAFALRLILTFGDALPENNKSIIVKPIILKAFTLPDRQIRVLLLASLPKFMDVLTKSDISDRIFQHFVTGFSDSNPAIREETIKAVLLIAPKLSERQLNNDLLRFLAKTQSDEKPEIRTNTTICLGKIAEYLSNSSRASILATAFAKAMKDPFIHSRLAAIMAITSCINYFSPEVISNKILSVIAPSLLDKSSKVRDEAQKAFDLFFNKIKEEASKLPPDNDSTADENAMDQVTSDVQNFGLNFSNALNKFTGGFGGSLNQDANNNITPTDSRSTTPSVVSSFQKEPIVKNEPTKVEYTENWGADDDEIQIDDDDGWGAEDDVTEFEETPVEQPKIVKPVVKPMFGSTSNTARSKPDPKPITRTRTTSAPAKKGLQLKPKAKSKLKLELDDTAGDDGWGDGW